MCFNFSLVHGQGHAANFSLVLVFLLKFLAFSAIDFISLTITASAFAHLPRVNAFDGIVAIIICQYTCR